MNGSQILTEQWDDKLLVFLYDESGSPIGMQYRTNSMAEGTFYTYLFEKNLQGDIIAVYNASGVRLISYVYDAWGNFKQTNHNLSESNVGAQYNPFTYRGYYYDYELDFYYLQSRYYDPEYGRFINADSILNANGDVLGYNLYLYCSNNPIMFTDQNGRGWNEFWQGVGDFFSNIGNAFYASIEAEVGLGWGIGGEISNVGVEHYWDFYLGIDDGTTVAGNTVSSEIGMGSKIIGETYKHCSEKGDKHFYCKDCLLDMSSQSIMNCSHSEKSTEISLGIVSINSNRDVIVGVSVSAHVIVGGHASVGFNISEFFRRLFD